MSRPQVIDDQEHERVHDRVAAIDVAKDSGMVCTRTPHPSRPGARRSTVWTVKARMGAVRALGRQLARDGIEMVTLESTLTTSVRRVCQAAREVFAVVVAGVLTWGSCYGWPCCAPTAAGGRLPGPD